MASATEIRQVQLPNSTTKYDLIAKNGIFYIEGTGSTAGTWLGSHDDIIEYYEGLTVAYKIPVDGASATTLNINSLGAVTVVRNATTAISTAFPLNSIIFLTYTTDSGKAYWKAFDYDTDTKVQQNAAIILNDEFPVILAYSSATSKVTNTVNKTTTLKYNPSTQILTAPYFNGTLLNNAITNDEIDSICGASIVAASEVAY